MPTTFQLCNDNGTPEDFHSRNVTYYHRSSLIHELTAVTNMTIGRCKVWKSNYSCWYQSTPSTTVGGILFQAGLLSGKRTRKRTAIFTVSSEFEWTKSTIFSSVRSSYSHTHLLLIHHQQQPPHFFRSHQSSTLDFHFLSHYSYIKAIMLY